MNILMFGHSGQVATEIRAAAKVEALSRDKADLADPAACATAILAHKPDAVINAAAFTAVDAAETDEAMAAIVNGDAPTAMAQACTDLGIPLVHISTDYVFDGSGETARTPDAPVLPINAYGRTKLRGEDGIRSTGGAHVILRTSWVFSAYGSNFVRSMLDLSKTHSSLHIVDDQIGGPTPAADIAAACLTIARALCGGAPGGTYHFAGAPDVSWAGFARAIFAAADRNVTVAGIPSASYPTVALRPGNSRLDCTSLLRDFAIPRPDWREGLDKVLRQH